jgi:hypothetical protein
VGAEPLGTAPDETVRRIKAESSQWTQVLATAKLHLD